MNMMNFAKNVVSSVASVGCGVAAAGGTLAAGGLGVGFLQKKMDQEYPEPIEIRGMFGKKTNVIFKDGKAFEYDGPRTPRFSARLKFGHRIHKAQ